MKKIQLIFLTVLCILVLIIYGCNQNTKTNKIITFDKLIDNKSGTIDTIICSDFNKNISIKDEKTVNRMIDVLKDMNIEEISPEKEKEIVENKKENYTLTFTLDKNIIGVAYIITNNQILFYDFQTLTSNKRSVAYLSTENYDKEINEIIRIIENLLIEEIT